MGEIHEEEQNNPGICKKLAYADIYVNDAFAQHTVQYASTAGVADYLPAVSGF